jgi:hypothetical protein
MRGMRTRLLLPLVLLFLLPPSAAADGPTTSRGAGIDGVVSSGGADRFTALPAGARTVLMRSRPAAGRVVQVALLSRTWDVPVVANDGTAGGLSADGRTLVLMQPARRLPRRVSRFSVLDARRLGRRQTIVLDGDWSFDAIAPDGATLYLTRTLNASATRYSVRAYDLRARRLIRKPVVDPSEPGEPLRGQPVTRTTGPGGRWEYTLYVGGPEPFVHALDTVRRTSICIDLPKRVAKARRVWSLDLRLHGDRIAVVDRGRVLASAPRTRPDESSAGGPPWVAAALAAVGLVAAAGARRALRRA